jgi:hypothetical protein
MTQEPKKYVIKEKQMNALRLELPPAIIDDLIKCPLSDEIEKVRQDERIMVLDEFIYWLFDCPFGPGDVESRCHKLVASKIESLHGDKL